MRPARPRDDSTSGWKWSRSRSKSRIGGVVAWIGHGLMTCLRLISIAEERRDSTACSRLRRISGQGGNEARISVVRINVSVTGDLVEVHVEENNRVDVVQPLGCVITFVCS